MKQEENNLKQPRRWPIIALLLLSAMAFVRPGPWRQQDWNGTYIDKSVADTSFLILVSDNYFSYTAFSETKKQFYFTWGGPLQQDESGITIPVEFHSMDKNAVGQIMHLNLSQKAGGIDFFGHYFKKLSSPKSDLAGCWRIAGRMQEGKMSEMKLGQRRTLKLLTDSHFQWMAINIETGEFSGTGGGSYEFKDGIYTENIGFFSRDSTRVGQSLSFNGKVEEGKWYHSGKSSRGDPISEVWVHLYQP